MIRLVYSNSNEEKCRKEAERLAGMLKADIEAKGLSGTRLIGPTSSYIARLRGKYQMQVIMLGRDLQTIVNSMYFPKGWILDVDPVGVI